MEKQKNNLERIQSVCDELLEYGSKIMKLYDELFGLSLVGDIASEDYKQKKAYIQLLHDYEAKLYSELFDDDDLVYRFNKRVIVSLENEINNSAFFNLIISKPELLPSVRLVYEFNRRLVKSDCLERLLPTKEIMPNYIFNQFNMIRNFKNMGQLLHSRMSDTNRFTKEYVFLSKYYHSLLFVCIPMEDDFLNDRVDYYTVSEFLDNLPDGYQKDCYIKENVESVIRNNESSITNFFKEPVRVDSDINQILSLYLIPIESTFTMIPKEYLSTVLDNINKQLSGIDDGNYKKHLLQLSINQKLNKYIK